MSTNPKAPATVKKTSKASKTSKTTKTAKTSKDHDIDSGVNQLDSLMGASLFDEPLKKKASIKRPTAKELEIDFEKDSQDEIIRKLVLNNQVLRADLNDLRFYADGTFCTLAVHNRTCEEFETKIADLSDTIEDMS